MSTSGFGCKEPQCEETHAAAMGLPVTDAPTEEELANIPIKKREAGDPLPVTILTGFLGAGKTTLLNHLMSCTEHKMKFAVIENEFGEVGVDENIVRESSEESVIEVMNGCICCTVRGDLSIILVKMWDRIKDFDGVLIETTGLADPAPVAQTFFVDDNVRVKYTLDGIITVVDAKHIIQHIDEVKPEGVENESVEQLAFADRILLNKTDLVEPSEIAVIEKKIKGINSQAPIFHTKNSRIHPKHLINIGSFDLDRTLEKDPEFLNIDEDHQHDTTVSSTSCKFEGELNVNKLQSWISEIIQTKSNDLFRYKGVLAVKGMKTKFVFQGVHMLFSGGFNREIGPWKKGEKRECRFVFIGRNLDKELLEEGFKDCIEDGKLRFKIGDLVSCNVGKWTKGKIIKEWDNGNPYRVELQDGRKTNIWVPEDNDRYCKKLTR